MPLKFSRQAPRVAGRPATLRGAAGLAAAAAGAGMLMSASTATAAPPINGLLAVGATGSQVSELQHALHLKRTDHFGTRTKRAVVRFQKRRHLEVDGVVGPQTWDTLFHITPPPAPAPVATAPAATTTTPTTSYTSSGYSIPSSIVQCESGGNWSAVNPSSGAGGAYQILPSTWPAYGGTGAPQDASPAEQSAIASRIYASQGPGAWTC